MKLKCSNKELNRNYYYVIRGGYCEFQNLLRYPFTKEVAYNNGVCGWNWDAWEINEKVCVCTGYRNMTGKRIEGLAEFDRKAAKIWDYYNLISYDEKLYLHKKLIEEFIDYIYENYDKGE